MLFSLGQLRARCAQSCGSIFNRLRSAFRRNLLGQKVSPACAASAILLTTAFMAAGAWFALREPPVVRIGPPLGSLGLQVGGKLPLLKAEGWLNGGPRRVSEQLGKIVVVDMWTDSCGVYCQATSRLRAVAAKYDDNPDVVFVGLTPLARKDAEQFLDAAGIGWSNGYGVDALEGVLPTIVVLGRDGRILWEDLRTRRLHSVEALAGNLNAAIVRAIEQQSAVSGGPGKQESYSAARAGG